MTKSVIFKSVGMYLPERRVSNDELARCYQIDTSDEWIRSHTGIGWRHIMADDQTTSDLGAAAARNALERGGVDASDVDLIVLSTASPDYIGCPSTACLVQEKIGAVNAMAFDITVACSGFVTGLAVAKGMMQAGMARRTLVISAEALTRFTDWGDRNTCVLFGDGAGAALLELSDDPVRGIREVSMKADGNSWEYIMMRDGGASEPYKPGAMNHRKPPVMEMQGKKVYAFAVKVIPEMLQRLADDAGIAISDLKWIVPHQANGRIIASAANQMKIPESRFFMNLEQRANTSSATVPIALCELDMQGGLQQGDLIAVVGFGGGLTAASALISW